MHFISIFRYVINSKFQFVEIADDETSLKWEFIFVVRRDTKTKE